MTMGMLFGRPLVVLVLGALLLLTLVHVIFSLPVLLLAGGVALGLWLRSNSNGRRYLGRGRAMSGYLRGRSRW